MKRGISGKGRGGSPPLPRQRKALRVVQLTLLAVAFVAARLAYAAANAGTGGRGEVAGLGALALLFAGWALWMGIKTVRGPEPPSLD